MGGCHRVCCPLYDCGHRGLLLHERSEKNRGYGAQQHHQDRGGPSRGSTGNSRTGDNDNHHTAATASSSFPSAAASAAADAAAGPLRPERLCWPASWLRPSSWSSSRVCSSGPVRSTTTEYGISQHVLIDTVCQ